MRLADRVRTMKPSATLALAAKARELADSGKDVVSLTVGEPDWDTYDFIKEEAIAAIKKGSTKYTPPAGIMPLRAAVAKHTSQQLGLNFDKTEVTVTAGSKFILFAALQMLAQPGDEVVIPAPYWVSYPTMVELTGATPKIAVCGAATDFKLTPKILESSLSPKTRVLILNSPSNPTGEYYTTDELKALVKVLERFPDITILSDDIYNRLVFDGAELAPHILQVAPQFKERTIVVNGLSKTYAMTGWRLGWALGPLPVIKAMTDYQSQSVSCAAEFTQLAGITALEKGDKEMARALKDLSHRRDLIYEGLKSIPGLQVVKPRGAFYAWPELSGLFGRKWKDRPVTNSTQFAQILLEDFNLAVVPGIEFGLEGYLRLSFVASETRLQEALRRLGSMCRELRV